MIATTIISGAGLGPIALWIVLGLAIGFALETGRAWRHRDNPPPTTRKNAG